MMAGRRIAVVVPTIRKKSFDKFRELWKPLFDKYDVELIAVWDGDEPTLEVIDGPKYTMREIMGDYDDVIYNRTAACRNLGFAYIAKFLPSIEIIISLDDDVWPSQGPDGLDSIAGHLSVLGGFAPTSWLSTAAEPMRGFPYRIRLESEVVVSHGVWLGIPDWDGPTQLFLEGRGEEKKIPNYYQGPIPKGIYFPMCAMNVAFTRKALPYMYQAPSGDGTPDIHRWDDIWGGITMKRHVDERGWAVVSGYSVIYHSRASNAFANVKREAAGLEYNEVFWKGWDAADALAVANEDHEMKDYFKTYQVIEKRWREWMSAEGIGGDIHV